MPQGNNSQERELQMTIGKILKQRDAIEEYSNYEKNREWLMRNWKRIARQYAGKVIVIHGEGIACSTEDAEEARTCLQSLGSPVQAYVRYIPAANEALLL
jgi:hypothetical protein